MTNARRGFLRDSGALCAALAMPTAAMADDPYPTRPIRIISPYPPGGIVDILSRALGEKLQASMGQPVVVEAKGGAGGNLGTSYVARGARGDPYTLLMGASGPLAPSVTLYPNLGYDPLKDLIPITMVAATPLVLTVNTASKFKTFDDLARELRARGDKINYASSGPGTPQHLAVEMMKQQLGVDSVHVAYRGSAPSVLAMVAGEVTYSIDHLVLVLPHIKTGKLRPLGVTSRARARDLPDAPTMQENGLPNFEIRGWYGLLAPAEVPDAIIRKLNTESVKALREPDMVARLASLGSENVAGSQQEFRDLISSEIVKWREVITKSGITAS